MEVKKSAKPLSGVHRYWVLYQPKGDAFTHIRNFDEYEDALELFNAVRVFHREYEIPVRIELREFQSYKEGHIGNSVNLLEVNTAIEEE